MRGTNPKAIEAARRRTRKVQQELEVASAELVLTQGALHRHLPPAVKQGDVAWAMEQNAAVERKVNQAAEDLEQVQELLTQAGAAPSS